MRRTLLSISTSWAFLCLLTFSLHAQQANLTGQVTDAVTSEPVMGATIQWGGTGTVTDFDGNYQLDIPFGTHQLEISYIGYSTFVQSVTVDSDKDMELDFQLTEEITLLQTATVTSGKFEKPLGEVTVSLDIIKPELLESNSSTSPEETLNKLPGVQMVDGQANIRGGSGYSYGAGSRVMLLVDDIPFLRADAGFPNWNDLPIENISQIEVIKGSASALYGSAALNGIINLRTAYATSKPETKASVFYTNFMDPQDTQKQWWKDANNKPFATGGSIAHKQQFGKLDLVTSAFYLYRDSWNKDIYNRYGRFTLGTRYRVNDKLTIGFSSNLNRGNNQNFFFWTDGEANAMIGAEGTFNTTVNTRFNIDPFINYYDKGGNKHKIMGRFYGVNNEESNNRSNQSNLFYGEYQFQKRWEASELVLTSGLVGSFTDIDAELYGGDLFQSNNYAAYLQLDKKFFDKLNLSGGVRFENNQITAPDSIQVGDETLMAGDDSEGKPIFRLGANYQLANFTYLRASWGQGYRFPTIAEKFISTNVGFQINPNPALTSETGWSAEIGLKQGFKISNWNGFFDVAAYWSQYFDMMEFTFLLSQFAFQSQNVGNTDIKGFDISVMGQGNLGNFPTSIIAGYTYIDPKFQDFTEMDEQNSSADYNILKYRNKHSLKLDIESKFGDFSLGFAGIYNSNVEAIDNLFNVIIPGLSDFRAANMDGYTVLDIRTAYQFTRNLKLSIIAKNILNEEYTVRPALLEAPRNITGRLDFKF